ncbi:hypothetical protein ACHAXR_010082 [Thalassiosira sp. AJA248-18]
MESPPSASSTPLLPPQYCYRYTPSTSLSTCPSSYFALACKFQELARKYPEFQNAWADLRRGQRRETASQRQHGKVSPSKQGGKHDTRTCDDQSEVQSCDILDGNDTCNTEKEASDTATPTSHSQPFSAQITHTFNASLARSLLHHNFRLEMPSLPAGRLCPPIPNRANYVCWLKELLIQSKKDLHRFSDVADRELWQYQGMDIGTGVSAIYPLLLTTDLFSRGDAFTISQRKAGNVDAGNSENEGKCKTLSRQWKFLATDIDPLAIQSARINVQANNLEDQICVVQVNDSDSIVSSGMNTRKGPLFATMEKAKEQTTFQTCLPKDENDVMPNELAEYPKFDFVMTNPPFYSTLKEATVPRAGDKRSRTDMSANESVFTSYTTRNDLVGGEDMDDCDNGTTESGGGDVGFIMAIMNDSQLFRHHMTWYTSLISKRSSLDAVLQKLQTLDGVWGNRGQIKTVEFRQENLNDSGENDEKRVKNGSPRVRWGIGWTYERAAGRCSSCQVKGGLQSFDVWLRVSDDTNGMSNADDKAKRASNEVVSRLVDYFEKQRDFSLKCSHQMRRYGNDSIAGNDDGSVFPRGKMGRCVTALEERFFNCKPNPSALLDHEHDNNNLPRQGHFIIDAFVEGSGQCNDDGNVHVIVFLEMYAHTKRGTSLINKIRGSLPGEIGRTNRRWRRLLKRQPTT